MAKLIVGQNDLATTHSELAKEWHPTKNGELKPTDVTPQSNKKVWWLLPYDDPKTGKHFDFEWETTIQSRSKCKKCPYLSVPVKAICVGFNDLATTHPEVAKEWHPTKNGKLKPTDVVAMSNKKVWWQLSYDDPKTGKHFDFEWEAVIGNRCRGSECPYLYGKNVWPGFNDLASVDPKLTKQWHPTKNGKLKPTDVTFASGKNVWWLLPYDDPKTGEHFDFEWEATVYSRIRGCVCPYLSSSCGETVIIDTLKDNGIYFEQEKAFANLVYVAKLRYDFFINNSVIIEYDGRQHFEPIDYFGGKLAFNGTRNRDNIKNQYCCDNNIPILRIPYIYDPVADKSEIKTIVLEFVKTHTIPKEILDFYKRQQNNNYCKLFSKNKIKKAA